MSRWSRSRWSYDRFPPKVSAADRRAMAEREVAKLRAKGKATAPVVVGRTIATTFWGKAWCAAIETHADWSNRLERGRTYVRSGAVIDLRLSAGKVEAVVVGSDVYRVEVGFAPLDDATWQRLAAACAGKVGSLLELLQGRLDTATLQLLCAPRDGLFPQPREVTMRCSCPDGARLCKHVAAALYGVGSRLDSAPELLFVLRQVEPAALLAGVGALGDGGGGELGDDAELAAIFGVEVAEVGFDIGDIVPVSSSPAPAQAKAPRAGRAKAATADEKRLLAAFAAAPDEELSLDAVRMAVLALSVARTEAALAGLSLRGWVAREVDGDGVAWWGVTAAGLVVARG